MGRDINQADRRNLASDSALPLALAMDSPGQTKQRSVSRRSCPQSRRHRPNPKCNQNQLNLEDLASEKRNQADFRVSDRFAVKVQSGRILTPRMLARAYDTPCPVDVIEKVLEGASERRVRSRFTPWASWRNLWVADPGRVRAL